MTNNTQWQTLSTKIVFQNKWMKVRDDEVIFPGGVKGHYGVVEKDPFVLIIPIIGDKIALVEQYRYPVEARSWEFPEGHKDSKNENIKTTGIRELQEETGLITNNLKEIGTLWLAPGHHTQQYTIFVATDCKWGDKHLEESEQDMKTKLFTLQKIKEMVRQGIIKDSPTIAALGLYLLKDLSDKHIL